MKLINLVLVFTLSNLVEGFVTPQFAATSSLRTASPFALRSRSEVSVLRMSETSTSDNPPPSTDDEDDDDEEDLSMMDAAQLEAREKARRADELRAQEVFMKKSTGKHECGNCLWEYDETKGDSFMIGGQIQPGTPFADLPSNWRCPTCRASKDKFNEVVIEIPGFEVNQGYGFGTNSMTSGQKTGLIFGGLGIFFVLFLGGYALS